MLWTGNSRKVHYIVFWWPGFNIQLPVKYNMSRCNIVPENIHHWRYNGENEPLFPCPSLMPLLHDLRHFLSRFQHAPSENPSVGFLSNSALKGWFATHDIWLIATLVQCFRRAFAPPETMWVLLRGSAALRVSQRPLAFNSLSDQFIFILLTLMAHELYCCHFTMWPWRSEGARRLLEVSGWNICTAIRTCHLPLFALIRSRSNLELGRSILQPRPITVCWRLPVQRFSFHSHRLFVLKPTSQCEVKQNPGYYLSWY